MTENKKDFFISYNGKDKDWAEWIAWQLEDTGYSVVIQAWDFRPGGNFVLEMQKAAQANRTLLVLSPNYLAAQFTQPEWAAAFAQDPTGEKGILLPVRVAKCDLQGLLPAIIYIDLIDLEETTARETLLAGAKRGRAKPLAPPGFPADRGHVERQPPRFPNPPSPISSNPRSQQPNSTSSMKSITSSTGIKLGEVKREVCRRLGQDWQDLADILEIPTVDRLRFDKGREPHGIWEWLESRGKLGELEQGLRSINRSELADLLPKDFSTRPQ
jgi:hypothetical protein